MPAPLLIATANAVSPFVPAGGLLLVILAIGLLLWALGGRLLRPGLALIGLIAGLPIGIWIGSIAAPEAPPVFFAAGGAIAGLVIASISYGLALASVTSVLTAVVAVLGAWSAADLGFVDAGAVAQRIDAATGAVVTEAPSPLAREALTRLWFASGGSVAGGPAPVPSHSNSGGPGAGAASGHASNDARTLAEPTQEGVLARVRAAVETLWDEMPQPRRTLLMASGAAGAVIGLLFGLLFADTAAKLVSSLAGSLILLIAGMPLLTAALGRSEDLLPMRPAAWFAAVGLLTIIGFGVQRLLGDPPPRSRPAEQ